MTDRWKWRLSLNTSRRGGFEDKKMAAPQGFEPQLNEPESLVLPLHHGAASVAGIFLPATALNIIAAELRTLTVAD